MSEVERLDVSAEAGMVKISRSRRATVVFPELEGPDSPMRRFRRDALMQVMLVYVQITVFGSMVVVCSVRKTKLYGSRRGGAEPAPLVSKSVTASNERSCLFMHVQDFKAIRNEVCII